MKLKNLLSVCVVLAAGFGVANTAFAQTVVQIKKRNAQDFALDSGNGAANGQNIRLWSENSAAANQQWVEINRGGGFYSYQKQGTNHCIDGGNGGATRQNVQLSQCVTNDQNQHWLKSSTDAGFYKLIKRNSSGFAINGGSGGARGQNVNLFSVSASSHNLQWAIEPLAGSNAPTTTAILDSSRWIINASSNSGNVANAIDGNARTRWTTSQPQGDNQFFEIDLSATENIGSVVLDTSGSANDYPRDYTLLLSTDGNNFETVAAGAGAGPVTVINFPAQNAQYVRIEQSGSTDRWWWSIHELNIFRSNQDDSPVPTPAPTPTPAAPAPAPTPPPLAGGNNLPRGSLFQPGDLIALHYDVAPDLDDLHAIAAGCSVSRHFGLDPEVVIGAHGEGRAGQYRGTAEGRTRQRHAQIVARAAYDDVVDTNGDDSRQWDSAVTDLARKMRNTINGGGDVWIADGGPHDFTKATIDELSDLGISNSVIRNRVHVVQHSDWNQRNTNSGALAAVQNDTDYIRIEDGNHSNRTADLNSTSDWRSFVRWADGSACGASWEEAFEVLDPSRRLDFSDTAEYLHILGVSTRDVNSVSDFYRFFD